MRLVTFQQSGHKTPVAGVVIGEHIAPLPTLGPFPKTIQELILAGPQQLAQLQASVKELDKSKSVRMEDALLLAPIPRPKKNIVCLGWNYAAHADESARATGSNLELPEHPVVFTKAPTTVNGPYSTVSCAASVTKQLDWEVELGVIIGRGGKQIDEASALDHVFGYTIIIDVSARDIQKRHRQFFLGKSLDGACPMGPWIVTADAIEDPQNLQLRTYVNGVLKQDGNTADQIFTVAQTISILSRAMTLEPGDIIATGTPDGVGFARTPPEFLRDGDTVTCEISEIGRISNRIVYT